MKAWWEKNTAGRPPAASIALFERAMTALWRRSQVTLGEVTLAAIVDRVLYAASENYSVLSTLKVEETGVRFEEFRRAAAHAEHLSDPMLFVLIEFLTVLGRLTDQILTPALHAELSKIAVPKAKVRRGNDKTPAQIKGAKS